MSLRRTIAILIFLGGGLAVASIYYPQIGKKAVELYAALPIKKQTDQLVQKTNEITDNILGEQEVGASQTPEQKVVSQIRGVSTQIIQQPEVQEITRTVNEIVNRKVEETKTMTNEQIESVKQDVRKQVYEEVCKQWLKE
jgi:predicted PurR-regulated permease PerM